MTLPALLRQRPEMRPTLSYRVRRMQSQSTANFPKVENELIRLVEDDPSPPTPAEQADNLILWLGDALEGRTDRQIPIEYDLDYTRIGGSSPYSLRFLIGELGSKGLLTSDNGNAQSQVSALLTLDGWAHYADLKRGKVDSRRAFTAMEYGDEKLDRVFDECFRPAVAQTGFTLERADTRPEAGSIPNRMRLDILRSRFVIADLTNNNLGAYWEAGYAEGLGRPVIYTCERSFFKETGTHFDVTQQQHVLWENSRFDEAIDNLKVCIRVTLPDEADLEDRKGNS